MKDALEQWDIARNPSDEVKTFYMAGPAGIPTQVAFSQSTRWPSLDLDRAEGCIRSFDHAFSKEGGLAVLRGNIALDGCVVKTAGVDESILVFEGSAYVTESPGRSGGRDPGRQGQGRRRSDRALRGSPRGGPGMQEMLYPTSYIKSKGLGKACALLTDGRFSGGTSGLSIGHCSPEAAAGGAIGLVRQGDRIRIDIPNRSINVLVSDEELAKRRGRAGRSGLEAGPAAPAQGDRRAQGLRLAGHLGRQGCRAQPVDARLTGEGHGLRAQSQAMLIHPQIDPIALQLGPLAIHWYGLTYLAAFGLFILLGRARLKHEPFASVPSAQTLGRARMSRTSCSWGLWVWLLGGAHRLLPVLQACVLPEPPAGDLCGLGRVA